MQMAHYKLTIIIIVFLQNERPSMAVLKLNSLNSNFKVQAHAPEVEFWVSSFLSSRSDWRNKNWTETWEYVDCTEESQQQRDIFVVLVILDIPFKRRLIPISL